MKIGVLIDEIAPGSACKVVGQTVRGLNKLGHQAEALVIIDNGKRKQLPEIYDFHMDGLIVKYIISRHHWWDFKFPGFSFFSFHHLVGFLAVPFIIKDREYDMVIANCSYSVFTAWALRLFRHIPYVYYIHCDPGIHTLRKIYVKTWLKFLYPILFFFAYWLDKAAIHFAEASIVSGNLHKLRFAGIEDKNLVKLVLGCVPAPEFIPYSQREKTIIAFDRWDKGHTPIPLLDFLKDNDFNLRVGGFWYPEDMRVKFMVEAVHRGLLDRVLYIGHLNEQDIIRECSNAMVHIHLNQEAFGMPTLEAAACGCCIFIPGGSGVADLFTYNTAVFYYSEDRGKENWRVGRNYTWERYSKNLERILLEHKRVL
jgi:hypothetical protein